MQENAESPLVIVGAGLVGIRLAAELLARLPETDILVFGAEPHAPYDRIQLGKLLSGQDTVQALKLPLPPDTSRLHLHLGDAVVAIDRKHQQIHTQQGLIQPYHRLILATGATPVIPPLEGIQLAGVSALRTLGDVLTLQTRARQAKHIIVLGGGLLGVETASQLATAQVQVTLIERQAQLLQQQGGQAGAVVRQQLETQGIRVLTGTGLQRLEGESQVTTLILTDGQQLACDLLILAIGVQPDTVLARAAGLTTGRGILINDCLQTSDPHIFAIGDCAEHNGQTYGLVAPGYEQAALLARRLAGEDIRYHGTQSLTAPKLPAALPPGTVADWPDEAIVCQCNQISRGQLDQAIRQGCNHLDSLCARSGAATNCGSCRPLLAQLLGSAPPPTLGWKLLQTAAFLAIFTGLLYLILPGLGYQDSVIGIQWDRLWRDTLSRQITGFTLLGIAVTISFIAIRKRVRGFRWGEFASWRQIHVLLGLLIMVTLLIHTGARFGENLNQALMICFIGVLLTGGLLGLSIANEHRLPPARARRFRLASLWLHLLWLWPLPALLGFHILKSYYF